MFKTKTCYLLLPGRTTVSCRHRKAIQTLIGHSFIRSLIYEFIYLSIIYILICVSVEAWKHYVDDVPTIMLQDCVCPCFLVINLYRLPTTTKSKVFLDLDVTIADRRTDCQCVWSSVCQFIIRSVRSHSS